jgi:hypothetical protein
MNLHDLYEMRDRRDAYQRDYDSSTSGMGRGSDHRGLRQELAHERNNIQIAINGRPWKVVAGRGTADSAEERKYLEGMKQWAERKSSSSGKKWTVYLTGAEVSESQGMAEAKKKAVPSNQRDPGALATRQHIAGQERKHRDWAQKQKELESEFYANHPELDDRKGVAEGEYDSRKPFGVRYKVFAGREGRVTTKEYWTTSSEKLEKAVAKIEALGNFYEIDGYSYPKEQQGVAEGWKGELAGGTIGGIAGNLAGSALGGPIGGIVGGAVGGAGGGIIGRELTKEEQLNEFAPVLAAGARLVIAMAPKIAQVLKNTGKATAKAVAPVAKSGAEIASKNAGQIGVGLGAYEIGSSVADIAKDITAKVGTALEEKTVMELAQVAFKFAIPAGIVLAILYGGKKVIDSLFSDSKTEQGVAEGSELKKVKREYNQAAKDAGGDRIGAGKKIDDMKKGLRQKDVDNKKAQSVAESNELAIDPAESGEYDYEGDQASDQINTIVRAARRLDGLLDSNENMPEWVQMKVTLAADYLDTAADYIESNQEPELEEGDRVGNMDADKFDAAMARLKQLAGAGPMKTVWDPAKRVYRNVPAATQPKK